MHKEELQQWKRFGTVSRKTIDNPVSLNQFYSRETLQ